MFNEWIDAVLKKPGHPELVDVQHRWVTVVEDLGVAELMVRLPDKGIRALQERVKHDIYTTRLIAALTAVMNRQHHAGEYCNKAAKNRGMDNSASGFLTWRDANRTSVIVHVLSK